MNSGINREHMDTEVRPADDLFGYVNGGWIATTEIPEDRGRYGSFDMLREAAEGNVKQLIEDAAATKPEIDSAAGKVGALYASFMDTDRLSELGVSVLVSDIEMIVAMSSASDVAKTSATLQRAGIGGLAHLWVTADASSPQDYIAYLHQGGIGLPDEAYYREEEHEGVRQAYQKYVQILLDLAAPALDQAGLELGDNPVQRMYALQERIAKAHRDRVASRDAVKSFNKMSAAELADLTPGWDWAAWAEGLGAPAGVLDHIVARQPEALTAIADELTQTPIADWQAFLVVELLESAAPYLSDDFVEAHFDFNGRTLTGTPQIRDRWKRGVGLVEGHLGEAAGEMYVAKHYPPEAQERMQGLVDNVLEAFRRRISGIEWMGQETRERAQEKLAAFRPKIGHPPTFRDYSDLEVESGDLWGNVKRGSVFEMNRELAKVGSEIDRDEWLMTPQTVNAYYHPMLNEIVFPAAILQPPFFNVDADDAVNYGGIGAVIAHEIGHGFDDQGSRYAGDGSLTDWWTESDRSAFDERAQQLIAQFSDLSPRGVPDAKVNGGLTVGENIGDLCGLEMSLSAYLLAAGDEAPEIDGMTGVQRFFMGYAAVWQGKSRLEESKRLLSIDPHAPADLRGNTVRNVEAFHDAFETAPGDGLWLDPAERVRIF